MELVKPRARIAPKKKPTKDNKQRQKLALIKRSEPEPEKDLEPIILEWINQKLESGKQEVLEEYSFESEKEKQKYLFHNRCKILKPIRSKNILTDKFLEKFWFKEIEYLKNNKFPYGWMEENPAIKKMNRKNKPLMPICNLLRNMAREATESQKQKMVILSRETVHTTKKMVKDKNGEAKLKTNHWPVFCFQTNKKFYEELADKTGYSTSSIKRYISSMARFGILKSVKGLKQNHGVPVYSFGYFTKHDGRDLFHHWLTKAEFQHILQDFHL